ncbi:MAG TPA: undecaprenyl-diphosphate phosphatase [Verrucomicrobiae bacterium]|nr:undecaprenyl-diphosphate phosphatase [Verrucomicrobiae bacterium]
MTLWHVILLAIVQGLAELLPVSSSAHVIVAEKLMGMDPSAPETTLLLVMLHTGTMFAVIVYFWERWRRAFLQTAAEFKNFVVSLILATLLTGVVGGVLTKAIEKLAFPHQPHAWVEQLFGRLDWIAAALAVVGVLILVAGLLERRSHPGESAAASGISSKQSSWIGAIQGICLPFRGFSRSGATISAGMLLGVPKARAEDFSFALAVVLTPVAIARELLRLVQTQHLHSVARLMPAVTPSIVGSVFAFLAGLVALKWLSRWLETGRWYWFGVYCLLAALAVGLLYHAGF